MCFRNVFDGAGASEAPFTFSRSEIEEFACFVFSAQTTSLPPLKPLRKTVRFPPALSPLTPSAPADHPLRVCAANNNRIFYRTGTQEDFNPVADTVEEEGEGEGVMVGFEEFCYRMRRAKGNGKENAGAGAVLLSPLLPMLIVTDATRRNDSEEGEVKVVCRRRHISPSSSLPTLARRLVCSTALRDALFSSLWHSQLSVSARTLWTHSYSPRPTSPANRVAHPNLASARPERSVRKEEEGRREEETTLGERKEGNRRTRMTGAREGNKRPVRGETGGRVLGGVLLRVEPVHKASSVRERGGKERGDGLVGEVGGEEGERKEVGESAAPAQ